MAAYRIAEITPTPLGGVCETFRATTSTIIKRNSDDCPYAIPNEFICSELGRFLGLPVPPAGILSTPQAPTTYWFGSLDFNHQRQTLPWVDVTRCVALLPELSAGLFMFDLLIANSDRHSGNFAVDFSVTPPRMSIFDQGHALFGQEQGRAIERFKTLRLKLGLSGGAATRGNRHCLLDELTTAHHFHRWLQRVRSIPNFLIDDLCNSVGEYGVSDLEISSARSFLRHRRDNLHHILNGGRREFTRIATWDLFIGSEPQRDA